MVDPKDLRNGDRVRVVLEGFVTKNGESGHSFTIAEHCLGAQYTFWTSLEKEPCVKSVELIETPLEEGDEVYWTNMHNCVVPSVIKAIYGGYAWVDSSKDERPNLRTVNLNDLKRIRK